jgi:hypothetical protein
MPDVISLAPADVRQFVALDVHKLSIVAATLPPTGGRPEVHRIETTERAIRRFIAMLGGPVGLAVCYEAGPGGFALWRLLSSMGVACHVVAPSLIPVRAGDRVKTDRRDAHKLVTLYRGGLSRSVAPPTLETEGLRDLLRCRDDIRCARTAARHRVAKQLWPHPRVFQTRLTSDRASASWAFKKRGGSNVVWRRRLVRVAVMRRPGVGARSETRLTYPLGRRPVRETHGSEPGPSRVDSPIAGQLACWRPPMGGSG